MTVAQYVLTAGTTEETWDTIASPDWNDTDDVLWENWGYLDLTDDWRSSSPVKITRGLDQVTPTIPAKAGSGSFVLDNVSGDYTLSPRAGTPISIEAVYDGDVYPLCKGYLDTPALVPEIGRQEVGMEFLGNLARFSSKPPVGTHKISTALYQNVRTDLAIGYVLDAIGWPADQRELDEGTVTLLWWWVEDADPWNAIRAIVAIEGPLATFYESPNGYFVFKNGEALSTETRSMVSQATFSDAPGATIAIAKPFGYSLGEQHLVNYAKWTTKARTQQALQVVWTGPTPITLQPNQSISYNPNYTNGDPFNNAVTPTSPTDYTVTVGSLSSVTIDRTSGQSVMLVLTAGNDGATVTGLQLRAQPVTVESITDIANTVQAPLAAGTLQQPLNIPIVEDVTPDTAQQAVNGYVGLWYDGRPLVDITLFNINEDVLLQQLTRDIYDRVTIVEQIMGLDADFWIVGIEHEITEGGSLLKTTFHCVQATGEGWFVLDFSALDGGDGLGPN